MGVCLCLCMHVPTRSTVIPDGYNIFVTVCDSASKTVYYYFTFFILKKPSSSYNNSSDNNNFKYIKKHKVKCVCAHVYVRVCMHMSVCLVGGWRSS